MNRSAQIQKFGPKMNKKLKKKHTKYENKNKSLQLGREFVTMAIFTVYMTYRTAEESHCCFFCFFSYFLVLVKHKFLRNVYFFVNQIRQMNEIQLKSKISKWQENIVHFSFFHTYYCNGT